MLSEKIRLLEVSIGGRANAGQLLKGYRYAQSPGGPELEDRTLALKLFAGRHGTRAYPTTEELIDFGRRICGVSQPTPVLQRIADAMQRTLRRAAGDGRGPGGILAELRGAWEPGMMHAR